MVYCFWSKIIFKNKTGPKALNYSFKESKFLANLFESETLKYCVTNSGSHQKAADPWNNCLFFHVWLCRKKTWSCIVGLKCLEGILLFFWHILRLLYLSVTGVVTTRATSKVFECGWGHLFKKKSVWLASKKIISTMINAENMQILWLMPTKLQILCLRPKTSNIV